MSEDDIMAIARLHRGNHDWEAFSHFSHVGLITFVRAIEQASRRAALDECWDAISARLPSIRAKTGNALFDAGTHDACQKVEAILTAAQPVSEVCPICKGHSLPGDCSCPCQMGEGKRP